MFFFMVYLLNENCLMIGWVKIDLGIYFDGFYYFLNENRFNYIIVKVGKNRFNIKFCILNNYIVFFKNRVDIIFIIICIFDKYG